jgi:hypothetical protein
MSGDSRLHVGGRGFNGGSQLLKDGARDLKALASMRRHKAYIVCIDADELCGEARRREVEEKIIKPAGLGQAVTSVVPTWEIESWILADINAASKIFGKWKELDEVRNPENIPHAKEYLKKLCCRGTTPPYNHATHNQKIAEHLDLAKVYDRCSSFRPLMDLVCKVTGRPRPKSAKR